MADQDFSHTAEIIKAAIPYVDGKIKGMAETFAKLLDLMGSFKSTGKSGTLAASGLQGTKIDLEGLLRGIRPICTLHEQEIVDKILNIFNMKRTFEMYNNMMSAMNAMQEYGGFSFGDSNSENDAENVAGNFSGTNFESIFQNFNTGFSSGTVNAASEKQEQDISNSHEEQNSRNSYNEEQNSKKPYNAEAETKKEGIPASGGPGSGMNSKMLEMLKSMVPPEQMSTFENLSMLLNTMSYDNNSKSDESKEQSDA